MTVQETIQIMTAVNQIREQASDIEAILSDLPTITEHTHPDVVAKRDELRVAMGAQFEALNHFQAFSVMAAAGGG